MQKNQQQSGRKGNENKQAEQQKINKKMRLG